MSVAILRMYAQKLRPVWTSTWRDLKAPSLRSGVPQVLEEDIWFNKQIAQNYHEKHGLSHLDSISQYISKTKNNLSYTVPYRTHSRLCKIFSVYSVTVQTTEKIAMSYFLNLLTSCIVTKSK